MRNKGEADCEVGSGYPDNNSNYLLQAALPREIQFQFGRADCVSEYNGEWEQYKTDRPETHPNPEVDILIYLQYLQHLKYLYLQGNGDATLDFFRDQFSFNGRETAAIMGAHTLGRSWPPSNVITLSSRASNECSRKSHNLKLIYLPYLLTCYHCPGCKCPTRCSSTPGRCGAATSSTTPTTRTSSGRPTGSLSRRFTSLD